MPALAESWLPAPTQKSCAHFMTSAEGFAFGKQILAPHLHYFHSLLPWPEQAAGLNYSKGAMVAFSGPACSWKQRSQSLLHFLKNRDSVIEIWPYEIYILYIFVYIFPHRNWKAFQSNSNGWWVPWSGMSWGASPFPNPCSQISHPQQDTAGTLQLLQATLWVGKKIGKKHWKPEDFCHSLR